MKERNSSPPAIKLESLTKIYKKSTGQPTIAVDDVTLTVPQGIIFGLLGPNGAGKTTTIALICTLLRPNGGHIELYGVPTAKDLNAARRMLGLVFQENTLDEELTAKENLRFQALLYKLDKREERVNKALELVGLHIVSNDLVKTFSGGMKRRLEIARALISEPKILLLDEPTLGLDAASRREIWGYIQELVKQKQLTVLLTTHYMEEAERLCEYIAIMDHGKIVAQGSPEALISVVEEDTLVVTLKKDSRKTVKALEDYKWVKDVRVEGRKLHLLMHSGGPTAVRKVLDIVGSNVERFELKRPSLEDAYLHYTGKQYEGEKK